MAKEEIKEEAGLRFVGIPDEFEFIGMEEDVEVIEIKE